MAFRHIWIQTRCTCTISDSEVTQEEETEKLEQLRWLKAGWDIGCTRVDFNGVQINTQEDVYPRNPKMSEANKINATGQFHCKF